MDTGIIGWVATILGSGAIGSLLSSWNTRRWAAKDRAEDRALALIATHRNELRQAYVEFICASSRHLDKVLQFAGLAARTDAHARDAIQGVADELRATSTDADMKGYALLLVEETPERVETIRKLISMLEAPALNGDSTPAEVTAYVGVRREQLEGLVQTIAGAFSPVQWQASSATRPVGRATVPAPIKR